MHCYFTKAMRNNKGGRIWVEGDSLRRAGFSPNKRYRVSYREEELELRLSKKGERSVSKRTRSQMVYPIIDLNNSKILDIFEENTPLKCWVEKGVIRISVHRIKKLQKEREERLLEKLEKGQSLAEAALFAGGGISTHGIHEGLKKSKIKAKIDSVAELDKRYLQLAERNLRPAMSYRGKVEDIEPKDIREADILSFSMPCTGHSGLGKAKKKIKMAEEHEEASTAIFGVINYIVHSNPSVMVSENVVSARGSATYVLLKSELNRIGFDVFEYELDHRQAGSVEKRKRYWFVAVSKGLAKLFSFGEMKVPVYPRKHQTIGSLLRERKGEKWMPADYFSARLAKNRQSGRGFAPAFVGAKERETKVIPRNYTKRQISNPHLVSEDGKSIRLFNPAEHARIKGVPEKLVEGAADTVAHEVLGQSVLYRHAFGMGEMIGNYLSRIKAAKQRARSRKG